MNTQGQLEHSRALRIDRAAAAGAASNKTSLFHIDGNYTDNSCIGACNFGIPRSAVVRCEEKEARAKVALPP